MTDFVFSGVLDRCLMPLQFWGKQDYIAQWVATLYGVTDTERPAVLVTSITDASTADNLMGWVLYPQPDATVRVQQLMLFPRRRYVNADGTINHEAIRPRETVSEDGQPISEWRVHMDDLPQTLRDLERATHSNLG